MAASHGGSGSGSGAAELSLYDKLTAAFDEKEKAEVERRRNTAIVAAAAGEQEFKFEKLPFKFKETTEAKRSIFHIAADLINTNTKLGPDKKRLVFNNAAKTEWHSVLRRLTIQHIADHFQHYADQYANGTVDDLISKIKAAEAAVSEMLFFALSRAIPIRMFVATPSKNIIIKQPVAQCQWKRIILFMFCSDKEGCRPLEKSSSSTVAEKKKIYSLIDSSPEDTFLTAAAPATKKAKKIGNKSSQQKAEIDAAAEGLYPSNSQLAAAAPARQKKRKADAALESTAFVVPPERTAAVAARAAFASRGRRRKDAGGAAAAGDEGDARAPDGWLGLLEIVRTERAHSPAGAAAAAGAVSPASSGAGGSGSGDATPARATRGSVEQDEDGSWSYSFSGILPEEERRWVEEEWRKFSQNIPGLREQVKIYETSLLFLCGNVELKNPGQPTDDEIAQLQLANKVFEQNVNVRRFRLHLSNLIKQRQAGQQQQQQVATQVVAAAAAAPARADSPAAGAGGSASESEVRRSRVDMAVMQEAQDRIATLESQITALQAELRQSKSLQEAGQQQNVQALEQAEDRKRRIEDEMRRQADRFQQQLEQSAAENAALRQQMAAQQERQTQELADLTQDNASLKEIARVREAHNNRLTLMFAAALNNLNGETAMQDRELAGVGARNRLFAPPAAAAAAAPLPLAHQSLPLRPRLPSGSGSAGGGS